MEGLVDIADAPIHKLRAKGELVDRKDRQDMVQTPEFLRENPYKTPPNTLTAKRPHKRKTF